MSIPAYPIGIFTPYFMMDAIYGPCSDIDCTFYNYVSISMLQLNVQLPASSYCCQVDAIKLVTNHTKCQLASDGIDSRSQPPPLYPENGYMCFSHVSFVIMYII